MPEHIIRKQTLMPECAPDLHYSQPVEASKFSAGERQRIAEEVAQNLRTHDFAARMPAPPEPAMITKDFARIINVPTHEERWRRDAEQREAARTAAQARMLREEEIEIEQRAEQQAEADRQWNECADQKIAAAIDDLCATDLVPLFDDLLDQIDKLRAQNDELRNTVAQMRSEIAELYVGAHANAKKSNDVRRRSALGAVPVNIVIPVVK